MNRTHLMIPDGQVKQNVPLEHWEWIGAYIMKKKPDVIVCIGDWADMPSLSSYDRGKVGFEGRRYHKDIQAANDAMDLLFKPMREYNAMRRKNKKKQYEPEMHLTLGNHENRITRATESQPELEGAIGVSDLEYEKHGFTVHPFLSAVEIDGVSYAHYFCRSPSGRVMQNKRGQPNARTQVIREMKSCTAGHLQGMDWHPQPYADGIRYGLIAGSCYLHEEDYLTAQGTNYWRGIVMKRGVCDGEYSPWFVDLNWMAKDCTGQPLDKLMQKIYPVAA